MDNYSIYSGNEFCIVQYFIFEEFIALILLKEPIMQSIHTYVQGKVFTLMYRAKYSHLCTGQSIHT